MAKSIMQSNKECLLCGYPRTEEHHIFGGANRKLSEKYGLKVYLCHAHHNEPPYGVHFDKDFAKILHKCGQLAFEKRYKEDFVKIFGKNYKGEENGEDNTGGGCCKLLENASGDITDDGMECASHNKACNSDFKA